MASEEATLTYYNLKTPFPTEWPAELDDSDLEDTKNASSVQKSLLRRSKTRYSALERAGSDRRSLVPGTEKIGDGRENLVQRDEPDPLGGTDSVVRVLRQKGMPLDDDSRIRNQFLLSSTTFNPQRYLSQIHSDASTQSLLQGLDSLSRSIDQKSASLKVLVESNFERFVRAKTTIDNVYAEMRSQGGEKEAEKPRGHSRVTSRSSAHGRGVSGQGHPTPGKGVNKPLPSDKKKHALSKESEYGIQGIKAPLIEAAVKAEEFWGPALGGREREESLRIAMDSIQKGHVMFEVSAAISDSIKRKDYSELVSNYSKTRRFSEDAQALAKGENGERSLNQGQIYQLVIAARVTSEIDEKVQEFKRDVWKRLSTFHGYSLKEDSEESMALIKLLLELGVEDNPIWVWLLSIYDHLRSKVSANFARARVEIEVLRRRLATNESDHQIYYLKNQGPPLDMPDIIELWELIYLSLDNLLSTNNGVLAEVIDFWDRALMFIDGKAQKAFPIGIDGDSRKHHRLSVDGIRDLQSGIVELVDMIRENLFAFFADPPIEDISMLYSPLPPLTPKTPSTPLSANRSPFAHQDIRFRFDPANPPPPSPKKGEPWEEYAFWPPFSNSLSGLHYLGKALNVLGVAANEMSMIGPADAVSEKLKLLVGAARERCLRVICMAWNKDVEVLKGLEDWERDSGRRDITQFPNHLVSFENTVLAGIQKLLYIPEAATTKSGSPGIVSPAPTKLVQMVRSQFITSLYKALNGMVENAERSSVSTVPKPIRLLLTLSNLKTLSNPLIPNLLSHFETSFTITLTESTPTITSSLSQIETRLFQSFTAPQTAKLTQIFHAGISSPDWVPPTARPTNVRAYIYTALLSLVSTHSLVSTTTPSLLHPILSHHLENLSLAFLSAFKVRPRYTLPALMQATLDVEFLAATLGQYTSKRASEAQADAYRELDARTDAEARKKLQDELQEMRTVLKKLREGTKGEFGCLRGGVDRSKVLLISPSNNAES